MKPFYRGNNQNKPQFKRKSGVQANVWYGGGCTRTINRSSNAALLEEIELWVANSTNEIDRRRNLESREHCVREIGEGKA